MPRVYIGDGVSVEYDDAHGQIILTRRDDPAKHSTNPPQAEIGLSLAGYARLLQFGASLANTPAPVDDAGRG